jgi:acylphosphatase
MPVGESNARMKRMRLVVSGRVQGVCFRLYTVREASRLGLKGWVRNLRSGEVEVLAEGDEARLKDLELWCWHGPPHAAVTAVATSWAEATGEFTDFRNADE